MPPILVGDPTPDGTTVVAMIVLMMLGPAIDAIGLRRGRCVGTARDIEILVNVAAPSTSVIEAVNPIEQRQQASRQA